MFKYFNIILIFGGDKNMPKYRIKMEGNIQIECDEDYEVDVNLSTDFGAFDDGFDCSAKCSTRTYILDAEYEDIIEAKSKEEAREIAIEMSAKFEKAIKDGDLEVEYGGSAIVTCEITGVDIDFSIEEIKKNTYLLLNASGDVIDVIKTAKDFQEVYSDTISKNNGEILVELSNEDLEKIRGD